MTMHALPAPPPPVLDNVPPELRALPNWVAWKQEIRESSGKSVVTKLPVNPRTGGLASTTDPSTWASVKEAMARYEHHGLAGVGFVFTPPFCGIDLDMCRNRETGMIEPWAIAHVEGLSSYTELSPSGTGIHIIVKATLDGLGGNRKGKIELYDRGRYFTVTGKRLQDYPATIENRQNEVVALHGEIFGVPETITTGALPTLASEHIAAATAEDDEAIIRRIQGHPKYGKLWMGDFKGYPSQSEADLALVGYIAHQCGPEHARIDRLFRLSGLVRPKWDERRGVETYGAMTIAKVLQGKKEFYSVSSATSPEPLNFNLTDLGNAERLVAQHGADIRYCAPWKKWLAWDGRRWAQDDTGKVVYLSTCTVRNIYTEAADEPDKKLRDELASWAKRSEDKNRISNMIELARSLPGVPIIPGELDRDPWLLNVQNGTIDLQAGEMHTHLREDLITKLAPVEYAPEADCPRFKRFLLEIMDNNDHLVNFLRRAIGHSISGDTRERKIFILHGAGRNGKSTLLLAINECLGDYGMKTHAQTLMAKRDGGIPNDIARLRGARFVYASESAEGKQLDEALIKEVTGGEPIAARFLHAEWFQYLPEFKLWLGTNHKPEIKGTDPAIWDRISLVPFNVRFVPEEDAGDLDPSIHLQDKNLINELRKELPGILNWMVQGCLEWQRDGLLEPMEVRIATADYRDEEDRIEDFLACCCLRACNASCTSSDLYKVYSKWADDNGEIATTQRDLVNKLKEKGFTPKKGTGGRRKWLGLALRDLQDWQQEAASGDSDA